MLYIFCIYFAPHLKLDTATPLHYYDDIIATETELSTILLLHLIKTTVPHYSRHRVPLVFHCHVGISLTPIRGMLTKPPSVVSYFNGIESTIVTITHI